MGKRLRILAGPNGSGKSSVYEALAQNESFHWGVFVNADEIEKKLREEQYIDVLSYGVEDLDWQKFQIDYQSFVDLKGGKCGVENLRYIDKKLFVLNPDLVDSYLACYVAMYIRDGLLLVKKNITFTVETVMSHTSKLDFIRAAKEKGFGSVALKGIMQKNKGRSLLVCCRDKVKGFYEKNGFKELYYTGYWVKNL